MDDDQSPDDRLSGQTDLVAAANDLEVAFARLDDEKLLSLTFTDQGAITIDPGVLKSVVEALVKGVQTISYRVTQSLPGKLGEIQSATEALTNKVQQLEETFDEFQAEPRPAAKSDATPGNNAPRHGSQRSPGTEPRKTAAHAADDTPPASPRTGTRFKGAEDHHDGGRHGGGGGGGLDPSVLAAIEEKLAEVKTVQNQQDIRLEATVRDINDKMATRFDEVEKIIGKMTTDSQTTQSKLDEDMKAEFKKMAKMMEDLTNKDDDIMVLVTELERTKVGRFEIEELPRQLEAVKRRMETCEAEGRENSGKAQRAETLLSGVDELKANVRGLGESLREETSSTREWLNRVVDEVRRDIQRKAELEETRDATMSLQVDLESLTARLTTVGSALEALKTKADRGDVMMLREAVANLSAERGHDTERALFSARCLSCNRSYVDAGAADAANQVDMHAEKQQSLVMHQLQRALNDPRDIEKAINVVTVKIGKPSTTTGLDGTQYSTRSAQYGFALEDTALMSSKGFKKALPAPPPKDRKAQTFGESDFRHPLRKLLGRTAQSITSGPPMPQLHVSGSDASLASVVPGTRAQRSLVANTPMP